MKYRSVAVWPDTVNVGDPTGRNESSDTHDTSEQAAAVCRMLRERGLGGMGVAFPRTTRVEAVALTNEQITAAVKDGHAYYCSGCGGGGRDNDGEAYINEPCPYCGGTGITDEPHGVLVPTNHL